MAVKAMRWRQDNKDGAAECLKQYKGTKSLAEDLWNNRGVLVKTGITETRMVEAWLQGQNCRWSQN